MSRERFLENPFYVLGVRVDASRVEIEREGQKLLGMLELGLAAAQTANTPLGEIARSPDQVRQAMAELRDPHKRLLYEVWALLPPETVKPTPAENPLPGPWPEAHTLLNPGAKK